MYYSFRNNLKTALVNDITAEDTTISFKHLVNSTNAATRLAAWPHCGGNVGFTLTLIDNVTKALEIIRCTAVATNTEAGMSYTCERGVEDTTARSFSSVNCSVEHRPTADWFMNSVQLDEFTETVDTLSSTTNTANNAATTAALAKTTADSATTLATSAGTAAAAAQTTADAANTAAAAAKTRADDAHAVATSATSAAAAAQNTANNAVTAAATAQTTANTATTAANNASTAASAASDIATEAKMKAEAAQTTASETETTFNSYTTMMNNTVKQVPTASSIPMTNAGSTTLNDWISFATASKPGIIIAGDGVSVDEDGYLTSDIQPRFGLINYGGGLCVTRAPRIGRPVLTVPERGAIIPDNRNIQFTRTAIDPIVFANEDPPSPFATMEYPYDSFKVALQYGGSSFQEISSNDVSGTFRSFTTQLQPDIETRADSTVINVTDIAAASNTRYGVRYFENTATGELFLLTNYSGIFKSTDCGTTWKFVSPKLGAEVYSNIAYGNGVYVCTTTAGVFKSTDLITWTQVLTYPSTYNSTNIIYDYENGQFVFIAKAIATTGSYAYDMLKTSQDGTTWVTRWTSTTAGAQCHSIIHSPPTNTYKVGTTAGKIFSIDISTYAASAAISIPNLSGNNTTLYVNVSEPCIVAIGAGAAYIARSTDGLVGATWESVASPTGVAIAEVSIDGVGGMYVRSAAAGKAIYYSKNFTTWVAIPMQGVTTIVYAIFAKKGFLTFTTVNSLTYTIQNLSRDYYVVGRFISAALGDSEWSDPVPVRFLNPLSWSV